MCQFNGGHHKGRGRREAGETGLSYCVKDAKKWISGLPGELIFSHAVNLKQGYFFGWPSG